MALPAQVALPALTPALPPHEPSLVIVPVLPQELAFAGEKVALENFDTRESLVRELSVTIYMHSRTLLTLLNTNRYLSIIEPILAKNGIPDDFKYLCMAESGLNPNICSPAGAAGLWQLMPAVGKSAGMIVTGKLDERYHVEKATQAACNYLRDAYKKFGSWTMAAASYNLGMEGVGKRIEKQGVKSYYDAFFPEETMRYVFRILSWKLVTESPAHYGFIISSDQYNKPLDDYREVEIKDVKIDWSAVAINYGTNYKMLRELNHWIRDYDYDNTSGRTFTLRVPQKKFRQ